VNNINTNAARHSYDNTYSVRICINTQLLSATLEQKSYIETITQLASGPNALLNVILTLTDEIQDESTDLTGSTYRQSF